MAARMPDFDAFSARAQEITRSIPAEFLEGIESVDVHRELKQHPLLLGRRQRLVGVLAVQVDQHPADRRELRQRRGPAVDPGAAAPLGVERPAQQQRAVVAGEAEDVWPEVLADFSEGRTRGIYRASGWKSPSRPCTPNRIGSLISLSKPPAM